MGLVKFVFIMISILLGINILLIMLGEFKIKVFEKNLDIFYFTGSFLGIALVATIIWGVFTI
jgi:hypothetical protein